MAHDTNAPDHNPATCPDCCNEQDAKAIEEAVKNLGKKK